MSLLHCGAHARVRVHAQQHSARYLPIAEGGKSRRAAITFLMLVCTVIAVIGDVCVQHTRLYTRRCTDKSDIYLRINGITIYHSFLRR